MNIIPMSWLMHLKDIFSDKVISTVFSCTHLKQLQTNIKSYYMEIIFSPTISFAYAAHIEGSVLNYIKLHFCYIKFYNYHSFSRMTVGVVKH